MLIKRTMASDLIEVAKHFSVIAILGPRQAGKTTLAKTVFSNHTYTNLEDPAIRAFAESDPRGFFSEFRNDAGMIIDEFQHVPDLLSYIQLIVDEEQKPGYFILTGSQNFLMNERISQTLAGRISIQTLLPLSIYELKEAGLLPEKVNTLMYQGSYPSIYAKKVPPVRWYQAYIQTYLERDVRQLKHIENLSLFRRFVQLCAGRIGQVVNFTSLGNDCGISDVTVRRWLSILEASYIVYLLRPFHNNFSKRLIKSPKLYFYDTGVASSLLNITQEQLSMHYLRGNLFENLIITEFYKHSYNHGKTPSIYFWRDQTGHEVDCILDRSPYPKPIEIKASRTISKSFFQGLQYWNEVSGTDPANNVIVYAGDTNQKRSSGTIVSWKNTNSVVGSKK